LISTMHLVNNAENVKLLEQLQVSCSEVLDWEGPNKIKDVSVIGDVLSAMTTTLPHEQHAENVQLQKLIRQLQTSPCKSNRVHWVSEQG